ncbi:MAG: radical SAM protein [Phycisphaerae bacterium]
MELPCRSPGDELLPAGELTDIRRRLRRIAGRHDLATVIACAFDHRTRMLPFIYADLRMAPAGARAVGSAMADAGFERTRIVLQQWNRNFRPSRMRLDGRVPDLFLVSSMQIHVARCRALIRDAGRIEPDRRPLVIAGGPKTIYEPWDVFGVDPGDPWGADVAVTGEEYVLLNLLEVLLSVRAAGEPMRSAFMRARDDGALDEVPGLVYARTDSRGVAEELVDTGVQRLAGDLDELPHPVLGYRLLERPGRGETLADHALPASGIHKVSPIGSLVLTFGCKFACPYCPIPAYNQRQFRAKSGERIADEMRRLHVEYGLRQFFGTDDNFFNDRGRTLEIVEALACAEIDGAPLRRKVRWATEVTVADTLRMKEHLPTVRKAGVRMLWLGVEDMTAAFIRKGQSVDRTTEAFRLLTDRGILPVPMLMHHDGQPLYSPGSAYGLLNQVRLLRKAGAVGLQVLMMTPAAGSKQYDEAFASGLVYDSAGGRRVEPHMYDANYVIASGEAKPWRKQLNILLAYLYFYNPLRLLIAVVRPRSSLYLVDVGMQAIGMYGLAQTIRRTFGWALRLMRGNIRLKTTPPAARVLIRDHLRSFPDSPRANVHSDVP